jgi:colicin import membrane protein
MAPKLKVFRTHLGFYDLIVAAPSQKAALEAWGAGSNLFAQGFASAVTDPQLTQAALARPGVVLKRQFGSRGEFAESVESLHAPKESHAESAARRAREKQDRAEAERTAREEREVARQRARDERLAQTRHAQTERDAAKRRALDERQAEKAEAAEAAERRRREERDAAAAERALEKELRSLMQQRDAELADIERREKALRKERKETEEGFARRIAAVETTLREIAPGGAKRRA